MRYALLMHYREPGEGGISEQAIAEAKEAFGAYGRALESAGVLLSADVLQPSAATTTVTCREGSLRVQDGPSLAAVTAEVDGPAAGLTTLDQLLEEAGPNASRFQPAKATRAHLLDRLGRREEAVAAYESAISLTHDAAERQYLEAKTRF